MMVTVNQHFDSLIEHGTGVLNEDFLVVEDNLFGVFDGATSLTAKTYEYGYTGGFLASNLAGEAFRQNNGDLMKLAELANQNIRRAMLDRDIDMTDKANLWSTSAAVVRIEEDSLEWAQIGDSRIVFVFESGEFESLCKIHDQDMETLSLWKQVCQWTDEPISITMHEQILKVRSRMNVDYGVFNGEAEAMDFLRTGKRDLCGVSHVLLFTDGFLLPNSDPSQQRGFNEHIGMFRKAGLKGIRDYIRSVEATDAECRIYPRFKTHDDIAAIAIRV